MLKILWDVVELGVEGEEFVNSWFGRIEKWRKYAFSFAQPFYSHFGNGEDV